MQHRTVRHLEAATKLLEQGLRDGVVVRMLEEKEGISKRQAWRVVGRAWKMLQEQRGASAPVDALRLDCALQSLLERAVAIASKGDPRALGPGVSAAMGLARLRGLLVERSEMRVSGDLGVDVRTLTSSERRDRMKRLVQSAGLMRSDDSLIEIADGKANGAAHNGANGSNGANGANGHGSNGTT